MRKLSRVTLSRKISLIILIMVVFSTTIVGTFSYLLYRGDSISFKAGEARSIAESLASAIDAERFRAILDSGEKDQYWYEIKAIADEIKERTGVMYLYVLDKNYDDDVTYFLEGHCDDLTVDFGGKESVQYHADEMFDTIETGEPSLTDIYDSEGYGMMVSGFAAILGADGTVQGVVGVDKNVDEVLASSDTFGLLIILCVTVLCILFFIISRQYIVKNIGKPITALSEASGKIAMGDLDVQLTVSSGDEIGKLTEAFKEMVESTKKQIAVLESLAGGDLTVNVEARSDRDTMSHAMIRTLNNLNLMFSEINAGSGYVSAGAGQIAGAAQSLALGTAEQSATVERLNAVIGSVADKTSKNAEKAIKAAKLSEMVMASAEKGSTQMEKMISAVQEINEASQSIGKVIAVIDNIASQTNILALNASVEAARAGQHGKGFAVVAEEVRRLASQSAQAASNTSGLIENSMEKAKYGASIAGETAASLNEIVSGVNESSKIMTDIASFSGEQNASIERINHDISQIVGIIHQNSSLAEESSASSEELSNQSELLRELVSRFRLKDPSTDNFRLPL